jgi:hypothetical protein
MIASDPNLTQITTKGLEARLAFADGECRKSSAPFQGSLSFACLTLAAMRFLIAMRFWNVHHFPDSQFYWAGWLGIHGWTIR